MKPKVFYLIGLLLPLLLLLALPTLAQPQHTLWRRPAAA